MAIDSASNSIYTSSKYYISKYYMGSQCKSYTKVTINSNYNMEIEHVSNKAEEKRTLGEIDGKIEEERKKVKEVAKREALEVKRAKKEAKLAAREATKREALEAKRAEKEAKLAAKEATKREALAAKKTTKEVELGTKESEETEKVEEEIGSAAKEAAKKEAKEAIEVEEELGAKLYEGMVELLIVSPADLTQIEKLEERLRQIQDLRLVLVGGSAEKGVRFLVSAEKSIPLASIIEDFSIVEQVTKRGKEIQISLKER